MDEPPRCLSLLEAQAAIARTIGQGLDPAVILVAATIEHHCLDAGLDGAFGNELADRRGGSLVGPGLQRGLQLLFKARGRHQGGIACIVDDLRVNVLGGAEHAQPWSAVAVRQGPAHTQLALLERLGFAEHGGLLLLAFLAQDVFALVANTLALIGLGRPGGADLGRHLPDLLLVDSRYGNQFLLGPADLHLDAGRDLVQHVMAKTHLHLQRVLALHGGAEADTMDLERLRIAVGHPFDQVDDLRPRHAPQRPRRLAVLAHADRNAVRHLLDGDLIRTAERKLALGPLHRHLLAADAGGHARGDRNRLLTYARHRLSSTPVGRKRPTRKRCTKFRHRRSLHGRACPTSPPLASTEWRRPNHWRRSSVRARRYRHGGPAWKCA